MVMEINSVNIIYPKPFGKKFFKSYPGSITIPNSTSFSLAEEGANLPSDLAAPGYMNSTYEEWLIDSIVKAFSCIQQTS